MSTPDVFAPTPSSTPSPTLSTRSRSGGGRLVPLLLGAGVVLTAAGGLVIGWFSVWFQLFGDTPDAEDYQVAAGAYATSALVLMLGAVAARSFGAPRWQAFWAAGWAAVLVFLALASASEAAAATDPGPGFNGWQDGAGGVLACPWTWPLLALGVLAAVRGNRVSA